MTDNEIFETEIKCINRRASGKCNGGTDCYKCDLLMNEKDIISAYERAIANINLINRQQEEIDELKHEREVFIKDIHHYINKTNEQLEDIENAKAKIKICAEVIERQDTEIDRLKTAFENSQKATKYWHEKCGELVEEVQTAQSEAYKGFAERLENRIVNLPSVYPIASATLAFLNGSSHRQLEILDIVESLLKEMIYEQKSEVK